MSEPEPTVRDNVAERCWEVVVDGLTASLAYARGPSVLALITTSIPEELGGRGIAGRLARHAMEVARENGLRVEPSCPFMIGWLDRHPEYGDLVRRPAGPATDDPFWF